MRPFRLRHRHTFTASRLFARARIVITRYEPHQIEGRRQRRPRRRPRHTDNADNGDQALLVGLGGGGASAHCASARARSRKEGLCVRACVCIRVYVRAREL